MSTETPLIVYLRHSPRKELAAELCIKDDNNYQLIGVSDRGAIQYGKGGHNHTDSQTPHERER